MAGTPEKSYNGHGKRSMTGQVEHGRHSTARIPAICTAKQSRDGMAGTAGTAKQSSNGMAGTAWQAQHGRHTWQAHEHNEAVAWQAQHGRTDKGGTAWQAYMAGTA